MIPAGLDFLPEPVDVNPYLPSLPQLDMLPIDFKKRPAQPFVETGKLPAEVGSGGRLIMIRPEDRRQPISTVASPVEQEIDKQRQPFTPVNLERFLPPLNTRHAK